jgi:hypothetical protein
MNQIVFTGIFCFISFISLAQTSIGIRGGFVTSSYGYQPAANSRKISVGGIAAPTYAFVFEHFGSKNAGIELNFQLLSIGFQQLNEDVSPVQTNETQFDYLKVPILSSFYAGKSGRFQIKFGPHVGYLLKATDVSREFSGTNPPELPTYGGAEDKPNKFMYGITAGAGLSKLFGKSTLAGEVRFAYDFTNPEGQDRIFDMNSTNLEFTLAYLFKIREMKE